jgi:polyisoprenoid-binding protein YceI
MKKTILTIISLAIVAVFVACGGSEKKTVDANPEAEAAQASQTSATYEVDGAASQLNWMGENVVAGKKHVGTLSIKDGSLSVEGENITAGEFMVDMNSMVVTDEGMPEDMKAKLAGHLSSDDFFNASNYPNASFSITKVMPSQAEGATHDISGNLTIRDKTKEITIPAQVSMEGNMIKATSQFAFNRADFDVKYGSSSFFDLAKDKIISDEIEVNLTLMARKAGPQTAQN